MKSSMLSKDTAGGAAARWGSSHPPDPYGGTHQMAPLSSVACPADFHAPSVVRVSRRALQIAAPLIILAVVAGPLFELDRYQVPKELILHGAACLAAAFALRGARRMPLGLVDLLLVAYVVLSALAALGALNGWLAFRAVAVTISSVALFWTARAIGRAGIGAPLLGMLAFSSVLGAVTGLLQAYGVELPFESARRAPGGMFGNRNFMAHLVAMMLPLIAYLSIVSRARVAPLLGSLGLAVAAAALLLSRSRAAWLAVAAGLALFAIEGIAVSGLWRDAQIRRRLGLLVGAAALGVALALTVPNALEWRSRHPYLESLAGVANFREGSGRGRLVQFGNSLRMAADYPLLGVGTGNWAVHYPRYTTPGDPAFDRGDPVPTNPWPSSDWVALAAERGIPALVCLGAALIASAVVGWRRSRQKGRSTEGLAGLAMVATVVVTMVMAAFDAVLLQAAPAFFFWTTLGVLAPAPREVAVLPMPSARRILLSATLIAGFAFTLRSSLQTLSIIVAGDGKGRRAVTWAARLDPSSYRLHVLLAGGYANRRVACADVIRHARQARELFPHHAAPPYLLRRCRRERGGSG